MNNNYFYHSYLYRPARSMKFFTLFVVFCMLCINVFEVNAQKYTSSGNIVITGVVKDASGFTLPGVNIIVKGQTRGTATDLDGKFSIGNLSNGDILVFSFLGMNNHEYHVVNSKVITIKMSPSAIAIQEVVAVGYASQKRATLVGAVASVDSKKLESVNGLSNLTAAISGQLEGVNVQQTSGQPGSEKTDIIIRSATTWNSTDPLILVDGVERPMSDVDVNEVASISVLKDASATAVYGVKGGNGVILITTKRGEEGKPKVSAQYLAGMKWKSKMYGTMNSYDYLSYKNDAIEVSIR